jgi:hypothetical protein
MTGPINRFDTMKAHQRAPKPRPPPRPESVPEQMRPHAASRAMIYRVVTMRGQIGVEEFPNAWEALAWGHECRLRNFWWVEARIGVE